MPIITSFVIPPNYIIIKLLINSFYLVEKALVDLVLLLREKLDRAESTVRGENTYPVSKSLRNSPRKSSSSIVRITHSHKNKM